MAKINNVRLTHDRGPALKKLSVAFSLSASMALSKDAAGHVAPRPHAIAAAELISGILSNRFAES
jgi:hypothetical protein